MDCLNGVIRNYDELQELWQWSIKNCPDTEMKGRIRGISDHMKQFDYCFGIHLAHLILSHCDNLSKTLQYINLSAVEAQTTASWSTKTLKSLRNDSDFDLFFKKVKEFAGEHDIGDPPSISTPERISVQTG